MKLVGIGLVILAACGGEQSAEERICIAANGCGALSTANVDSCIDRLDTIDASRALDECADCLEANTCAQIAGGACAPNCSPFAAVLSTSPSGMPTTYDRNKKPSQLTPAERMAFCEWALEQLGGEGQRETCTIDGRTVTFASGSIQSCVDRLTTTTCNVAMAAFEACYELVDSPCDVATVPQCAAQLSCVP